MFESIDDAEARLAGQQFFADRPSATAVFMANKLFKPLYFSGPHGSGKTALVHAAAAALDLPLIEIRCGPGTLPAEVAEAWKEASSTPAALLFDEVDSASPGARAELALCVGQFTAESQPPPLTALTDNGGGDPAGVLPNASILATVDYPPREVERSILLGRVAGMTYALADIVAHFVGELRPLPFRRPPGVGESIAWGRALVRLQRARIDADTIDLTLSALLRDPDDAALFRRANLAALVRPSLDVAA
jgi:MoxR-like ATPase